MRSTRILVVMALALPLLIVGHGDVSGAPDLTEGCVEKSWGYRCHYGPIHLVPEEESRQDIAYIPTPPEPGYITSMYATLIDPDDNHLDHHEAHLHHIVWGNPNRKDLTCGDRSPFDRFDRFFAAGQERTKIELPDGYGYYWDAQSPPGFPGVPPTWVMIHHLHTMIEGYETDVFVRFDIGFVPESEATLTDVTPVWLDVRNCSDSEYDIARGAGRRGVHRERWRYEMPVGGEFVALGGHLHSGGIKLRLDNRTAGRKLFVSRASYGRKDPDHLKNMTSYTGTTNKHVDAGDVLRLTAYYDSSSKRAGAMGIMIGAIAPDG